MKIHHFNCGSMCSLGGRLLDGKSSLFSRADLVCHCLVLETSEGLVLVDTGLGTEDVKNPKRLGALFNMVAAPQLAMEETALHRVQSMGYKASDVRHILISHLHLDHAGGISDFPLATVHTFEDEYQAAINPSNHLEEGAYPRYIFKSKNDWNITPLDGDSWMGFDALRTIKGLENEIFLVPIIGHTKGHCAIAIKKENSWLMHCGDAIFHPEELVPKSEIPQGLIAYQKFVAWNWKLRNKNLKRLQALKANSENEIEFICSHHPEPYLNETALI